MVYEYSNNNNKEESKLGLAKAHIMILCLDNNK